MKYAFRRRRLVALVAAVLAITGMLVTGANVARATTTASSQSSDYVPACQQKVAKGDFTCFAMKRTNITESPLLAPGTSRAEAAAATPAGYSPAQIQSAYDLPAATGTPTIAIIDAYDDPDAESDLAVYRAQYDLPACTTANGCFEKVGEDGSTNYPSQPPAGDDWGSEITLDLDAVSAACPGCHILLVEANSDDGTDLLTSVTTARTMGAKFISMSWGGSEDGTENSTDSAYFDYPGTVFTASSGDNGYSAGPIYPSTSQYTVSVGGTSLTQAAGTTRGWSESAWSGAGSGCSGTVTKPQFQSAITACPDTRADTDISADADPNTGIAVYNTFSDSGWDVYGGTSLSSPLIAAMYALAGTPVAGTWPASYPYDDPHASTDLNDVTTGSNGSCSITALCTAGPGWDGPTGLGTPDGVGALTTGPHGIISGTVTDASTGKPVAGATVSAGAGYTSTTDTSGDYTLGVPAGSYNLAVSDYGYGDASATGVTVADGATVTENFTLTATPTHTISGTVTDGSGHKWPIRAKITISGDPSGPIYSNQYTGKYSVTLPDNASYTLSASAVDLPGYTSAQATVKLAAKNVTKNIALAVDSSSCAAPGYAYKNAGVSEDFTGWTGSTPRDGWTVTDNNGSGDTWGFNNPGSPSYVDPPPNNDASFASVDDYHVTTASDTSLTSPVINLSSATDPQIVFDLYYIPVAGETADVDLSLDGGTTWSTVWTVPGNYPAQMDIPISQAAGDSDVKVRFHWTFTPLTSTENGRWWSIGNLLVGEHTCSPTPGGLAEGIVKDANTGKPVNGVTVTSDSDASQSGVSGPASGDPGLPNGYYWLFSSHTGTTGFKLTGGNYTATTDDADVTANAVTQTSLKIDAGRLTVSKSKVSVTEVLGASKTTSVTFANTGTAPVAVSLSGTDAGFTQMGAKSTTTTAPKIVKTRTSLADEPKTATGAATDTSKAAAVSPESAPWADLANYPDTVMDDAVAYHDGKVYVIGGSDGTGPTTDAYVYDPTAGAWSAIAPLPEPLNAMSAGFIGDTLYVAGGWDSQGNPSSDVWAYDPGTNSWSPLASLPAGVAAAGTAVVSGKLYLIGGCQGSCSTSSDMVYSYDPGDNAWSQQPGYPVGVTFPACGGVDARVVCAGGSGASTSTYVYTPGSTSWVKKANMPDDAWGAAAASADGQLDVIGGAIDNGAEVTNQGFAYNPMTDTWSALPDANYAFYRGGGACGIYQVGGAIGGFQAGQFAEQLPGYDQCDGTVSWLSVNTPAFTLKPGHTLTVHITADSSVESQPGSYAAQLVISAATPYPSLAPVGVTMQANPPATWGKITGTVTDASGAPISGATIAICTMYSTQTGTCGPETFTLTTDGQGDYQLWLNHGFSPLEIIAADNGYTPVMKIAKLAAGATTTANVTLRLSTT